MARVGLNLLLYIILNILSVECFKILGICPAPYLSHYTFCKKILTGLAKEGHEITMVTFVPLSSSVDNVTEILLQQNEEQPQSVHGDDFINLARGSYLSRIKFISGVTHSISKSVLENSKFKALLQSEQEFDLVMMQMFYCEALLGVINRFKCPVITFTPFPSSTWIDDLSGNVVPMAYSPTLLTKYSRCMTFFERLRNIGYKLLYYIYIQYTHLPQQYKIYNKHFPDAPHLQKLIYNNISLFFVNSNPVISGATPAVPSIVDIAGIHLEELEALPQDLQEIMDSAKYGVIYFSLGSIVGSKDLPPNIMNAILESFSKRKEIVLWKFENSFVQNLPPNVIVKKWFPQHSVLAHPNLKVFITHGGGNSLIEAVYFGVPLLGIPLMSDQIFNIATAEDKGFAIKLDLFHITEELFASNLKKIIEDPKYKENAKISSKAFRDRVVKPMDTMVFWTEYVVRNNGARHLRTQALNLHWTQIYLLDIAASLTIAAALIILLLKASVWIYTRLKHKIVMRIKEE